jgi:hypothetical protein
MITGMHPRRVPFEADVQFPAMAAQVLQAARPQTLLRQASQGECLSVIMQPARRARRAGCIPFRPPRAQKVLLCLRVIFEGPVLVSRHKRAAALSLSLSFRRSLKRDNQKACGGASKTVRFHLHQQRRRQNKTLSLSIPTHFAPR